MSNQLDLYQQVILEHNRKPKNFRTLDDCTHHAEGFNPLCGDHLHVYLKVDDSNIISDVTFQGSGCAISKASASMMTSALKGMKVEEGKVLFDQFHRMLKGQLDIDKDEHILGKLKIFSGVQQYPSRVKCAALGWHTFNSALEGDAKPATTE
jgi:nitrogen fixation NifU-like protein